MQNRGIYEYAIIRFVPIVEREEFINIGVIVLCQKQRYLRMKFHLDERRMKALSDIEDCPPIEAYIRAWEEVCAGAPLGGKIGELDIQVRFRWLTASRSTIIQSSKVHPGIAFDPERTLEDLFERYVL